MECVTEGDTVAICLLVADVVQLTVSLLAEQSPRSAPGWGSATLSDAAAVLEAPGERMVHVAGNT